MDDKDILPCPICGSVVEIGTDDDGDWVIDCECGISFQCFAGKACTIEEWNKRYEQT